MSRASELRALAEAPQLVVAAILIEKQDLLSLLSAVATLRRALKNALSCRINGAPAMCASHDAETKIALDATKEWEDE